MTTNMIVLLLPNHQISKCSFAEHFLDVRDDRVRTLLRLYVLHNLALSVHKELRVVPWNLSNSSWLIFVFLVLGGEEWVLPEIDVDWVRTLAININLLRDEVLRTPFVPVELLQSLFIQRLLVKRVAWELKNLQPLRSVFLIDLNKLFHVRARQSSLRPWVHKQIHLFTHINTFFKWYRLLAQ